MIERLTARATTLPNLRGRVMDGQALDLDDDSFDVAVSLNGVSLFPDVDAGIAEMARVTRPGGRVAIACFARGIEYAEFIAFFVSAIRTGVPDAALPPFDPPPPPFQLADPEKLSGKLLDAGLTRVSVESANWEVTVRSATHFWDAATASNPIAVRLIAGLTAEQRADARQVLDGMLRERSHGSPMAVLHNAMNIGTGIKPRTSQ